MQKMKVIPEPKTGLHPDLLGIPGKMPVIRDSGNLSHACGACEAHLVENISAGDLRGW